MHINQNFCTFFFIFLFLSSATAQTSLFKGQVLSEDRMPIPYALVNIFKSDTAKQSILTKFTSEDGSFTLQTDSFNDKYMIQITHLSYETLKEEIDLSKHSDDLKYYYLITKIQKIQEITVIAKAPQVYRDKDKIIMNVQDNPFAAGKTPYSLLQMAPGVLVFNNQISINGVSGTQVYINGKELKLSGTSLQNYLNSLRGSDIKYIEIIAQPSAEYDAESLGGIINIILKKSAWMGTKGYVGYDQSFGFGKYPTYNPYASLNFNNKKLQLSASYAYSNQESFLDMTQDRTLINNGKQSQVTNDKRKSIDNDVNISMSYDISDQQNIGVYYYGSASDYESSSLSQTRMVYPGYTDSSYSKGIFSDRTKTKFHNAGFNYEWITDTLKSKLIIIGDFTYNNADAFSQINSKTFNYSDQLKGDTLYNYVFPNLSKIYTLQGKYKKKYKSGTEFSFGGKLSITDINTDNTFQISQNNNWNNSQENDFNYSYKESISAAFIDLSGTIFSVDFRIGIRGENSYVKGHLDGYNQDSINTQKYFDLFPSIYFGKALDKNGNHHLSLSYNRRIGRPGYSLLNPYKYYNDNYSIASGNPYLHPAYTDVVGLGYTLKNTYYFGLTYTQIKDQINNISKTDSLSAIINYTPENIGSSSIYSFLITAPIQVTKWWSSNNSITLQYKKMIAPQFKIEKGTYTLQSNNEFTLGKSTTLDMGLYYNRRSLYGNTITQPFSNVTIGLTQYLLNNKLILNVDVWDLFYQNNPKMVSYYNNSSIYIDKKFQTRQLNLSAIYTFNVGKLFKTKQIEKSNESEKSRLK